MPGLLSFHAHPDDEVISTGGILARYSALGEDVAVVTATDGVEGEVHNYEDIDDVKSRLAEVRAEELAKAMAILGVGHHEFLGFRDSGMMGTEANDHPEAFWNADFMEASKRLVSVLRRLRPEVMVIYDPFGGYGHPDHIQVHRVGMAAYFGCADLGRFPLAGGEDAWQPSKLYWTAWPRSRMIKLAEVGVQVGMMDEAEAEEWRASGTPDEDVTARIDVRRYFDRKLEALTAHKSQIPDDWFLLKLPQEIQPEVMGHEYFVRISTRVEAPVHEDDLFTGLR